MDSDPCMRPKVVAKFRDEVAVNRLNCNRQANMAGSGLWL